ncbi:hypothetical protein [Campylobacter suis]|uniref:Holin n=1 Tax=Campylobacter suis TaxID=2790657 RepID=A0ABN7K6V9_9BACT|nr:hypothetical protein [Campylobacter suis]CAD7288196.1 hypothetical protein LMG8286_01185 [Campylobacter suis]
MNEFLEWSKDKPLVGVLLVGFIGGMLNLADPKKSITHNILNIITGVFGSMFLCWIAYEVAFYFIHDNSMCLAVGGFFAWRGANWANETVDKLIKSKIESSNKDYPTYDDYNKIPPMPRNLDDE